MANFYLSPFAAVVQLFTDGGVPASGGLIWTYLAGTTTPASTYTDQTGLVFNSNPIQMGSNGRPQTFSIWQQGGVPLKYVFSTNAGTPQSPVFGTQLGPTYDQISGINDPTLLTGFTSGNFLATFTGFSGTAPTATVYYSIQNNVVTVMSPGVLSSGTSNAVTFGITGIPAAIQPPTTNQFLPIWYAENNGATASEPIFIQVVPASSTWNVGLAASSNAWTASGTKGIQGFCFSYLLI